MLAKRHHFIFLWITLAAAIVSLAMIPRVNVNSDMTKYLPDSSQMKQGLDILAEEFGSAQAGEADVRVMLEGLDSAVVEEAERMLTAIPEVEGIASTKSSKDGRHTLIELNVPKSVDQKALGKEIASSLGKNAIIETSQDGNTPPLSVIIIAAAMIIVLLVLMSGSWLDPLLLLISAGMAIAINIGTNALLPSVSITTNYIGAILQLVLSLDYSIVLLNRYRQEKSASTSGANIKGSSISPIDAINAAIPKSFPSIFSSALTTIVGLLMLVFMKLRIGADMGIVLAKGVICSLVCTFSALPSVIIILHRLIETTDKRNFVIPTDRIASFTSKYKIPLASFFTVIFILSLCLHGRTEISFSSNGESQIDGIFPRQNAIVLLYGNGDEERIISLADSLHKIDGVNEIISYPTLLKKEYTASEMASAIKDRTLPPPEILRLAFYMKNAPETNLRISFPELADFITGHCMTSPLLEGRIDEGMKEKMALLGTLTEHEPEAAYDQAEIKESHTDHTEVSVAQAERKSEAPAAQNKTAPSSKEAVSTKVQSPAGNGPISIVDFMPKLYAYRQNFNTGVLKSLVDVARLRKRMDVKEMSDYIGSTPSQTKMVYSFSKTKDKLMTPLEYTHLLADDLFNRKVISSMVSKEQKEGLYARRKVMDLADAGAKLSAAELATLISDFGESWISEELVRKIAFEDRQQASRPDVSVSAEKQATAALEQLPADTAQAAAAITDTAAVAAVPEIVKPRRSKAEIQAELLDQMLHSGRKYTARQMTRNIAILGEKIDPGLIDLLYLYYGSVNLYDERWSMSIEELMDFVCDDILDDPRFDVLLDEGMRHSVDEAKTTMAEGLVKMQGARHSIAAIITDLPYESSKTYSAIDRIQSVCEDCLKDGHYLIGESVMYNEMKNGFKSEMQLVTWLTVLAIFLIVAISFRSVIVPAILVMTVMCAVFVNIIFSGIFSGSMLYLAYLITQSILMGATIDYGILFANYYKEKRKVMGVDDSIREAYRGSIHTIMTSGLIMIFAPGVMAVCVKDVTISAIVGCISIGAAVAVALILAVLPGILAAFDRLVVHGKVFKK